VDLEDYRFLRFAQFLTTARSEIFFWIIKHEKIQFREFSLKAMITKKGLHKCKALLKITYELINS